MNNKSKKPLIEKLGLIKNKVSKEGFVFKSFVLETEGNYSPLDIDWNYKDVPHAEFVHETVDNTPIYTEHDICCSIAYQRVTPFLRFPIALVNFDYDETSQLYYSTLLFWIILIHTKIVETGSGTVLTKTEYHIGSPKWFAFSFGLIRFLITRNYRNLMAGDGEDGGDLGMRKRRWWLRSNGYSFASDPQTGWKHSFLKSRNLAERNVVPPLELVSREYQYDLDLQKLKTKTECLLGKEDHSGILIRVIGETAFFYPRICMHQGACLDNAKLTANGGLQCPWHGLVNEPLEKLDLADKQTANVRLTYTGLSPAIFIKAK